MSDAHPVAPAKARIIHQDYADGDRDVEVVFNPSAYTIGRRSDWREHPVLLADVPKVEFVTGGRRRLDVLLVVDTSLERRDVRAETDRLEAFSIIDPDLHRPPHLLFSWGSLQFEGVLEGIETSFVLFEPDGTPVRALARLAIRERPDGEERDRRPLQSPDRAKRRRIRQGETLPLIAHEEYGDPSAWRRIAVSNGLDDPDRLPVGRMIVVPPLERGGRS